ncbi:hypothetical protein DFH09DRAFT_1321876 [Mycena vulgaris]|nr:hypothetical protein DFH09DRAFT_1321876 [Mycena vulgaris]
MQNENVHPQRRTQIAAVLRNYFYSLTLFLSTVAWLVAFAAQIAVTKIVGRGAVGVMWFAVFLQLFLNLGVLLVLAHGPGSVAAFRLQLSFFATMAAVFAVFGVDMSIFTNEPSRAAMGAGWLVLAIVDILWILCFSAEPGTPLARLVESMVVTRRRDTDHHESSSRSVGPGDTSFYDAEMRSDGSPDETKVGHDKSGEVHSGSSPDKSPEWRGMDRHIVDRSQELLPEAEKEHHGGTSGGEQPPSLSRPPPPSSKNRRAVYVEEHRQLSTIYDNNESNSEGASRDSQGDAAHLYPFKVRARSDWIPRSPSEISFRKGDVLHSAEKDGKKWWKVRKTDGSVGSAPSNYFKVLST